VVSEWDTIPNDIKEPIGILKTQRIRRVFLIMGFNFTVDLMLGRTTVNKVGSNEMTVKAIAGGKKTG
jgi:hypothetical protein